MRGSTSSPTPCDLMGVMDQGREPEIGRLRYEQQQLTGQSRRPSGPGAEPPIEGGDRSSGVQSSSDTWSRACSWSPSSSRALHRAAHGGAGALTMFGRGRGGLKTEPGLYFSGPTRSSRSRVRHAFGRLLKLGAQQTADAKRSRSRRSAPAVEDPLILPEVLERGRARGALPQGRTRSTPPCGSATGVVNKCTMGPVHHRPAVKLEDLESKILAALRARTTRERGPGRVRDRGRGRGAHADRAPQETTKAVFDRMKTSRERWRRRSSRGNAEARRSGQGRQRREENPRVRAGGVE